MPRPRALRRDQPLLTSFRWMGEQSFVGFVADLSNLTKKFVVEILIDGSPVKLVRADQPARELAHDGIGDGCYGFAISLRAELLRDCVSVEARLANLGSVVGAPILLDEYDDEAEAIGVGEAQWLGGVRFAGWIENISDPAPIRIEVDGSLIDQIRCATWRHLGTAEDARPVRGFDFHLPSRFADGRIHRLIALTEGGQRLDGCPITFLAHQPNLPSPLADPDGLSFVRAFRGDDPTVAASVPFSAYRFWRERRPNDDGALLSTSIAVLMFGSGETSDTLESLREQIHRDWTAVSLTPPPRRAAISFRQDELEDFLGQDGVECEIAVCALAGSLFAPNALHRIAEAFWQNPQAIIAYGDFEQQGPDGSLWPIALPAFDYERMLEQGYCAHLFAMRRATLVSCLSRGANNLYRLFNAALDEDLSLRQAILHLPVALATLPRIDASGATNALRQASALHLQRRQEKASCAEAAGAIFPAVRILRSLGPRSVTIIMSTRSRVDGLSERLVSLPSTAGDVSIDVLVIDNGGGDGCCKFFSEIQERGARVVQAPGAFNHADLMNRAARAATGEALCLLDSDLTGLDNRWLEEMLSRLGGPNVGAVGALLISASGVVEHGGAVLGPRFASVDAFADRLSGDAGYADLLRVAHECSAVSSACLLVDRKDYLAVGGMDAVRFPMTFNAVDLCLKLRAKGQRIIFTPYARLKRVSSRGRRADLRDAVFERELRMLRAKWGSELAEDPYYNPTLALDSLPYSALAWPPRPFGPRTNIPPAAHTPLPGF